MGSEWAVVVALTFTLALPAARAFAPVGRPPLIRVGRGCEGLMPGSRGPGVRTGGTRPSGPGGRQPGAASQIAGAWLQNAADRRVPDWRLPRAPAILVPTSQEVQSFVDARRHIFSPYTDSYRLCARHESASDSLTIDLMGDTLLLQSWKDPVSDTAESLIRLAGATRIAVAVTRIAFIEYLSPNTGNGQPTTHGTQILSHQF